MELFHCPVCLGLLRRHGDALRCTPCDVDHPIVEGIPRLLDPGALGPLNRRFEFFYDRLSPFYDRLEPVFARAFGGKHEARGEVLAPLAFEPGHRVLDVGCGTATMLEHYPVEVGRMTVYGVDLSWGQIVRARRKLLRDHPGVALAQATAERLPFADETFDVVYHMGGINFFSDPPRAVREMLRVARPGATLSIVDEAPQVVGWARVFSRIGLERVDRAALRLLWGGREAETAFIDRADRDPAGWAPRRGVRDVSLEPVWRGRGFRLSMRKEP